MTHLDSIFFHAHQRATELKLLYAGALLPREAYDLWQATRATLVDVRTQAEWDYVGRVRGAVEVQWNLYPSGRNPDFARSLQAAVPDKHGVFMFMCRSGGRSNAAAEVATQLGYARVYNVLEGFEGDLDSEGHRNAVGGWRAAGLPWVQS
jgi:rhodanese-related sulfurtransferase